MILTNLNKMLINLSNTMKHSTPGSKKMHTIYEKTKKLSEERCSRWKNESMI